MTYDTDSHHEGVINVRVRRLDQDETFEIDTPNLAFSILREGSYKIDVNEAGDTTIVTVRNGEGEVTGGGTAYTLHPREIGTFAGIDQLDADIQSFRDYGDDFDRFCSDRDRREDRSQSSRYVSSDVIGYEDLDDNGGWRSVPEYGTVWFHTPPSWVGRRIAMATGHGFRHGAGLGSMMLLGASRRSITVAG